MKILFTILLALGILPAPVSFERADGVSTAKDVEIVEGKRAFTRWSASLPEFARKEAYRLTITPKRIRIEANTPEGVYRAQTTLAQLEYPYPCGVIIDYPRFSWRGIMLDISRHFRDKDFILKQIDALSEVKLNVLHLHLTDAAGWRIEIKSHPELTAKTAWRVGDTWKEWNTTGKRYEGTYGGYLSQDDVREIVAYAAAHQMTIVPEIEMPGHSAETVYAIPGVGCQAGSDDLCPGKEATFKLLEDILTEVMDLFPSEFIHIGGDEAGKRDWHDCADCQRRMKEESLNNVEELQSYLVRRIEQFLNAHGRRLIGWDEILEGGLSPNATVMSWRGTEGGLEAIRQGHDAVMTPGSRCYLDKVQDAPVREPQGFGGYLPLDSIYVYDPAAGIPEASRAHLLGVQGNLWHEMIPTSSHTEYMLYPRAFAIAEIGWSPVEVKNAVDFRERATAHAEALRERGYTTFKLEDEVGNRPASRVVENHLGRGAKVAYAEPWHRRYPANREAALTDGILGGWSYGDGRWQGFQSDVDVTIDLGRVQKVDYVTATFLADPGAWIFLPDRVSVEYSVDGEHFTLAGMLLNENPDGKYIPFGVSVGQDTRYIRYHAYRTKEWLFVDEILIY
jgi:hexosaminidase